MNNKSQKNRKNEAFSNNDQKNVIFMRTRSIWNEMSKIERRHNKGYLSLPTFHSPLYKMRVSSMYKKESLKQNEQSFCCVSAWIVPIYSQTKLIFTFFTYLQNLGNTFLFIFHRYSIFVHKKYSVLVFYNLSFALW